MGTEVIPKTEEAVPAEAPSSLELQIIRQIEYYFGNYNLSRDKFLREQLKLDDGWVPLETMIKFNRLKKLSEDFNVIVNALKKSPKQLMEVNEDCTKIRRRTAEPVPDDYQKKPDEIEKRTIYVKGFKRTNTLDELLEFFKDYNVENIFMKKLNYQNNKPFKGSVYVTFETREDAERFFETKGIKFNGTELLKEWRTDYIKRKDELFSKLRAEKEKKLQKKEQERAEEEEEGKKVAENEMVPGCLLKIVNLNEDTTREQIQEVFEPHGTISYTDYSKGKPSAVLRFQNGEAKSILEKVLQDGETVKIGSSEATVSLIEGEEEKEYWKNIAVWRAQRRKQNKLNRGNRGNFQNKKRKWDRHRGKTENKDGESNETSKTQAKDEASKDTAEKDSKDEPPQKKIKVDSSEVNDKKDSGAMEVNTDASSEKKEAASERQQES